jgi:lipopolysaccharide transport system ATP-binding protein
MSSSDAVISVRNLTKVYRIYDSPLYRFRQAFNFRRKKHHREFTALDGISFEIPKGQTVGIIGRNGSGKSTLLQLVCGIRKPTSGEVHVSGRISALLELGAGFHPEFTGRENVYMQGAIMGLGRADMETRFPGIVAFADIGEFLDQPVKTYSSGMFVRLAFAVAVSVEPDILVVDEALSVGDIGFQQKCIERIREMREAGVTIFLVSHDILLLRNFGDTLIYLDRGRIKTMGDPEVVGEAYLRDTAVYDHVRSPSNIGAQRHKDEAISNCILHATGLKEKDVVHVHVAARLRPDITRPEIVIQLRDSRGYIIYGRHARGKDIATLVAATNYLEVHATLEIESRLLNGNYGISVSLNRLDENGTVVILDKQVGIASLQIPAPLDGGFHGCVNLGGKWRDHTPTDRELKGTTS